MTTKTKPNPASVHTALCAVISAGSAVGFWRQVPGDPSQCGDAQCYTLEMLGRRYFIQGGGYGREDRIVMSLAGYSADTLQVLPAKHEAGVNCDRDPATNAKSLYSRLVLDPQACLAADQARAKLTAQVAQRTMLRGHVETLCVLGYGPSQYREGEDLVPRGQCWSMTMYGAGMPSVEVDAQGGIRFSYSVSTTIENLPAVLKLLT